MCAVSGLCDLCTCIMMTHQCHALVPCCSQLRTMRLRAQHQAAVSRLPLPRLNFLAAHQGQVAVHFAQQVKQSAAAFRQAAWQMGMADAHADLRRTFLTFNPVPSGQTQRTMVLAQLLLQPVRLHVTCAIWL